MFRFIAVLSILLSAAIAASSQNSLNAGPNGLVALNNGVTVDFARQRFAPDSASREALAFACEKDVFELINDKRAEAGLGRLVWNEQLAAVARSHSQSMASNGFFSHRGLDGATVDVRADRLGIRDWLSIGENIAYTRGYDDAAAFAVSRWMQSTSHRLNILDRRWTETGLGVSILPDGTYFFTQVFILRK